MASESTFAEKSAKSSKILKLPPVVLRQELHTLIGSVKEMGLITTYEEVLEGLGKYIAEKKLFDEQNPYKVHCKNDELGSVLGIEEFIISDLNTLLQKIVVPLSKTYKDSAGGISLHSDNPLKRKCDGSIESDQKKVFAVDVELNSSPMLLQIPPSPKYCDASDSVDSIQGYETAYVKDTSDDFLSAENGEEQILAIEETYNIEYEVETDSSDVTPDPFDSSESDSEAGPESVMILDAAIRTFLSKPESDIEFFADDSSDDDSDHDVEIPKSDFWKCNMCGVSNPPPMRFCEKCFRQRLNWLPDKPSRKKRRRKKTEGRLLKYDQNSEWSSSSEECSEKKESTSSSSPQVGSCNAESVNSSSIGSKDLLCSESAGLSSTCLPSSSCSKSVDLSCSDVVDSTYSKSVDTPCSKSVDSSCKPKSVDSCCKPKSIDSPCKPKSTDSPCKPKFVDSSTKPKSTDSPSFKSMDSSCSARSASLSCIESVSSFGMESSDSPSSSVGVEPTSGTSSGMESTPKLCIVCCRKPAGASIIHGKYAHQISCYRCARKLQKLKKGCPVCRRTIQNVVHLISI